MQYMLFIATDTEPDELAEQPGEIEAWIEEGERRGIHKDGNALEHTRTATTIRKRKGDLLVTDGPFTESKEWIAGYDIIECDNLDDAIDYASRHPMARAGRIEIRPVMVWED